MLYIGLDYHTMKSVFQVLDKNGKKLFSKVVRGPADNLLKELSLLPQFNICFEASGACGFLYDKLFEIANKVVVAHPGKLRLIFRSKHKNDRIDAEKLAKLLFLGEVPPAYVPSSDIRAWRSMIEHRDRLVRERTRAKNGLKGLFRSLGVSIRKRLWSKDGLRWAESVVFDNTFNAIRRDDLLERIRNLNNMIRRVEKELNAIGKKHPGVQILSSIPGIGPRISEAVVAYIDDPWRFRKTKSIGNYFGMVPSEDSSSSTIRFGHVTKEGPPTVRRLITEGAWIAIRKSPTVRRHFDRIADKNPKNKKIAIIATAHYLLRVMLAMLKTGECWREKTA